MTVVWLSYYCSHARSPLPEMFTRSLPYTNDATRSYDTHHLYRTQMSLDSLYPTRFSSSNQFSRLLRPRGYFFPFLFFIVLTDFDSLEFCGSTCLQCSLPFLPGWVSENYGKTLEVLDRFSSNCLRQRVQKLMSEVSSGNAAASNFGANM